jgi:hypothetical protein
LDNGDVGVLDNGDVGVLDNGDVGVLDTGETGVLLSGDDGSTEGLELITLLSSFLATLNIGDAMGDVRASTNSGDVELAVFLASYAASVGDDVSLAPVCICCSLTCVLSPSSSLLPGVPPSRLRFTSPPVGESLISNDALSVDFLSVLLSAFPVLTLTSEVGDSGTGDVSCSRLLNLRRSRLELVVLLLSDTPAAPPLEPVRSRRAESRELLLLSSSLGSLLYV